MGAAGSAGGRKAARAGWLTRRQVARLVGLEERRVAQMDGRELHPIRRIDGSWTYDPGEVGALVSNGTASGTVAARAFGMFMAGKSDPEVVVETLQPARRIRELRAEYNEMAGQVILDRTTAEELRCVLGLNALTGGPSLAQAVQAGLEARYRAGFLEGRADAEDYGEVTNPITGERRRLTRSSS
jgi:hypothetical protein